MNRNVILLQASACCLAMLPTLCAAAGERAGPTVSWSAYAGRFDGNGNPQLTGQDTGVALALAVNWRVAEHLQLGVDMAGYLQQFDSDVSGGFLVAVDDRMDVDTLALSGQLLYVAEGRLGHFYAGGGLGYYRTRLTVDASLFGIPGYAVDESDNAIGTHWVAGLGVPVGEAAWLDVQYRLTSAEASFGEPYGRIDIGGDILMLGLQFGF